MASKAKEAQTQTVVLNGTTYPLRYDYGSLVAFTDELGVTIDTIEEAISGLSMDRMSVLVWAGVMDWTYSGDDDDAGAANIPPARVAKWLRPVNRRRPSRPGQGHGCVHGCYAQASRQGCSRRPPGDPGEGGGRALVGIDGLLKEAAAHGVMPWDFWRMTPREFWLVVEGVRQRELRAFSSSIAVAWHQARFTRAEKMPDLKKILKMIVGQNEPDHVPNPDELLAIVKVWNSQLGGTFVGPSEVKE